MTMLSLILLSSLNTADAKSAMTLAMENASPAPGDAVTIEVRWTNIYGKPLRIPANWADELKMWVFRVPPGEQPAPRSVSSAIEMSIQQARKMEWITVQPDEVLTHTIPIEIDECAEGCIGGGYYGQVNLSWGMVDGRRDDQILPEAQIPFNFEVKLPLDVVSASSVSAALDGLSAPTPEASISGAVTVTNTSGAPLWVAGPEHWQSACTLTDKKGETLTMQTIGGTTGVLTEDGYQLLPADGTLSVPVTCENMFEGKLPKKAKLTVLVSPKAGFYPIEAHEERAVLTGMVPSGAPVSVPKK